MHRTWLVGRRWQIDELDVRPSTSTDAMARERAKRLCEDGSENGEDKTAEGDGSASSSSTCRLRGSAGRRTSGGCRRTRRRGRGSNAGASGEGGVDAGDNGRGQRSWDDGCCGGDDRGDDDGLRHTGHDSGNDRWDLRGRGDNAGGRRSLDLAVADLGDGLDAGLGDGGDDAGEEGYGGSGETHLDRVVEVGVSD